MHVDLFSVIVRGNPTQVTFHNIMNATNTGVNLLTNFLLSLTIPFIASMFSGVMEVHFQHERFDTSQTPEFVTYIRLHIVCESCSLLKI